MPDKSCIFPADESSSSKQPLSLAEMAGLSGPIMIEVCMYVHVYTGICMFLEHSTGVFEILYESMFIGAKPYPHNPLPG